MPEEKRYRFPKSARLLTGPDFEAVFAVKLSVGDRILTLHGRPNELGSPRLGMAVSRKVGNAVRRNRWKRTLREAFRLAQHDLPVFDFVVLPRYRDQPNYELVAASLLALAKRLEKKHARRVGGEGRSK